MMLLHCLYLFVVVVFLWGEWRKEVLVEIPVVGKILDSTLFTLQFHPNFPQISFGGVWFLHFGKINEKNKRKVKLLIHVGVRDLLEASLHAISVH